MRIGIDARPMQLDAYRQRGIGGYLRHWIEAAQDLPTEFEFALLVDPALPPPQVKLTAPNWSLVRSSCLFGRARPGKRRQRWIRTRSSPTTPPSRPFAWISTLTYTTPHIR